MCGVIVVDAVRSRSNCYGRDAYIHDHCLRYRHNVVLFYQLLNSNLFTHRMLCSRKKPLVKPMAPGSISYHICFQSIFICIFTFCIYITKYQKYIIISLSDLTFASGHEGIDNPFISSVASSLFVYVGSWDLLRSLLLD